MRWKATRKDMVRQLKLVDRQQFDKGKGKRAKMRKIDVTRTIS